MNDFLDKTAPQKIKLVSSERLSVAERLELLEQLSKEPAKLVPSNNPYVLDKVANQNEDITGEYKSLEAKLDNYQPLAEMGEVIKKWILILNAIIIPVVIGLSISMYTGASKHNTNLNDIAAAISSKAEK